MIPPLSINEVNISCSCFFLLFLIFVKSSSENPWGSNRSKHSHLVRQARLFVDEEATQVVPEKVGWQISCSWRKQIRCFFSTPLWVFQQRKFAVFFAFKAKFLRFSNKNQFCGGHRMQNLQFHHFSGKSKSKNFREKLQRVLWVCQHRKFAVFTHSKQNDCDFRSKNSFLGVTECKTYHFTTFQENLSQKIFAKNCKGSPLMSFSTAEIRSFSHLMQNVCDFLIKTSFVGVTECRT